MYFYSAYGLTIRSEIDLPELDTSVDLGVDVNILIGAIALPEGELGSQECDIRVSDQAVYFHWDEVGSFRVSNGNEIRIDPNPNAEMTLLRSPLLGTVFAILMHQRGFLVLHGSAIDIDGGAVVFLGDKGMGKSTMAAMLHSRGSKLIADDVAVVDMLSPDGPRLRTAFPQFKLWPDAMLALGQNPELATRVSPQFEKRVTRVSNGFAGDSMPLKKIYVLGKGASIEIGSLRHQSALIELVRNSHAARLGQLLPKEDQRRNFVQCSDLLKEAMAYRLRRPYSLELLSEVCRVVEDHCGSVSVAI